jgi:hypothetical protein
MKKHVQPLLQPLGQSPLFQIGAGHCYDRGDWLLDLGIAYEDAGDVFVRGGHLVEAVEKYQSALGIFERLATRKPHDRLAMTVLSRLKEKNRLAREQARSASISKASPVGLADRDSQRPKLGTLKGAHRVLRNRPCSPPRGRLAANSQPSPWDCE